MKPFAIQSKDNPRVKHLAGLKEAKGRRKSSEFLVEGFHEFKVARKHGFELKGLYVNTKGLELLKAGYLELTVGLSVFELSEVAFKKISQRENPDGIVALANQKISTDLNELDPQNNVLVLESIEKPGNNGAILRSAAAFDFNQVVFNSEKPDPFHPHVIRNSRGHSLGMKFVGSNNEATLEWAKANHSNVCVATPDCDQMLGEFPFKTPITIVLGNEHDGVSDFWKKNADQNLRIPMNPIVDSLNVSVSASIVLYEVFKQMRENH